MIDQMSNHIEQMEIKLTLYLDSNTNKAMSSQMKSSLLSKPQSGLMSRSNKSNQRSS